MSHARIAALGARIVELPLLRTDEVLGVTKRAIGSISTRYHPLVFAAASALPMVGLAHSAYTWQRMRGASRQFGAERFVLPLEAIAQPEVFATIVAEIFNSGDIGAAVRATVAAGQQTSSVGGTR
ncbi:hypothetical protein P9139_12540 [Curtobacterium flaccumfaciens]|nr:hypothetical protein P9139_12540 [Curtobacterium flaccumfaciens]